MALASGEFAFTMFPCRSSKMFADCGAFRIEGLCFGRHQRPCKFLIRASLANLDLRTTSMGFQND